MAPEELAVADSQVRLEELLADLYVLNRAQQREDIVARTRWDEF